MGKKLITTKLLKYTFICLLLSSCTNDPQRYWVKKGTTIEERYKIRYICLQESQKPISNSWTSANDNNSYGGGYSKVVSDPELFEACMYAHGFSLEEERLE